MSGWRGRIGCVYPAVVAEHIFTTLFSLMPEGMSLALRTSSSVQDLDDYDLQRLQADIDRSVDLMAERHVDIIVIGGAPIFNGAGPEAEARLLGEMTRRTGIETTTTASAAVAGLKAVGARRIAVATAYDEARNRQLATYLGQCGFEVRSIRGLSRHISDMHEVPQDVSYRHLRDAVRAADGVDGLYIPGMQFPIPADIALLERDFGCAVVYAAHALLWYSCRHLGIHEPRFAADGRLLATLAGRDPA